VLDFLVRAYVPHFVLGAAAVVLFASQPPWPDAAWAKAYEPLRERTATAAHRKWEEDRRQWMIDRDTSEWRDVRDRRRQAEQEWKAGNETLRPVDDRLARTRTPVLTACLSRSLLLCVLTILCFVLTDLLVSPADGVRLLPNASSHGVLVVGAALGAMVSAWTAAGDPRLASMLFATADGLALTVLLFGRDAYSHFADSLLQAERQEEARDAELRGGTPGARREAQQFYAAHQDVLREAFPEALWRASLEAAIPSDAEAVTAWAAARALIERLQPLVARAKESHRQRVAERRQLLEEIGSLTRQIDKVRASPLDEDVIEDEVEGFRQRIALLEKRLAMLESLNERGVES
jgi:hypothetical protein